MVLGRLLGRGFASSDPVGERCGVRTTARFKEQTHQRRAHYLNVTESPNDILHLNIAVGTCDCFWYYHDIVVLL